MLQYDRFQQEGAIINKNALKEIEDMNAVIQLACQQTQQQVPEKRATPLPPAESLSGNLRGWKDGGMSNRK